MGQVVTIGRDLAKSVFQVRGIDFKGEVVLRPDQARAAHTLERLIGLSARLAIIMHAMLRPADHPLSSQRAEIQAALEDGQKVAPLAKRYDVSRRTIMRIREALLLARPC